MELAWLLPDQSCDRQQFGDRATELAKLTQQGYPVCPTLLVSVDWWQHYQSALTAYPIATLNLGGNPHAPVQLTLQQAICSTAVPQTWLTELATACNQFAAPALVLHPALVTATGIPLSLQDLWRSQLTTNTVPALTLALERLWTNLVHPHSLRCYQHLQLSWSQLQVALLIQPAQPGVASGRLLCNTREWQVEAIWGLGYRWLTNAVYPDYYAGTVANRSALTEQHQGSKHQILSLTPHGQLRRTRTSVAQQNQWVLSMGELQELLTRLMEPQPWRGELLWQRRSTGDWEVTQSRTLASPTLGFAETLNPDPSGLRIQGQGVVPGSVMGSLAIITPQTQTLPSGQILVATTLRPQQIGLLGEAVGLILEQGSATSHSVIVARELQIPTVIGVTNAIARLRSVHTAVLDGDQGWIDPQGSPSPASQPLVIASNIDAAAETLLPPTLQPATKTQVWAAYNHPYTIGALAKHPVTGVGLVRAELLLISLHPDWASGTVPKAAQVQERLQAQLQALAAAIAPQPLFYRFADWRSPLFPALPGPAASQADGLLGQRGVYAAQCNPWLFDLELAALKHVLVDYPQVRLILPFIRRVREFVWVRDRLEQEGIQPHQLWIMAETPAIAFDITAYQAAGAQGVAIGLNDLMQLILGIDRDVHRLVEPDDLAHPAIQATLKHLIQQADQANLPCSLCATINWSQHQTLVDQWVKWGLTAVVTELNSLSAAHQAIAQAETKL